MKSDTKISVEELIQLLFDCPTGLHIEQLEQTLWKARQPNEPVPKNFRSYIYGTLSLHSSQTLVFRQKRKAESQDLFFSPDGKGSGTWAVHRGRAEAWLRRKAMLLPQHSGQNSAVHIASATPTGPKKTYLHRTARELLA
jgi:hypothetical protein